MKIKLNLLNLLLEARTKSSQLTELANFVEQFFMGKANKSTLENQIYLFLTQRHDLYDEVMSYHDPKRKADRQNINSWYEKLKNALEQKAISIGWKINSNSPGWFQFNKPGGVYDISKNDRYKFYLTFARGNEYYLNLQKLGNLIDNLNNAKTSGKLSFKISDLFLPGYHHVDNLVVHYSDINDKNEIQQAIKKTNFTTEDRKKLYSRSDMGRDIEGKSDTQIISTKIVDNLLNNKDKILQKMSENRQEYEKLLLYIIEYIVHNASHR